MSLLFAFLILIHTHFAWQIITLNTNLAKWGTLHYINDDYVYIFGGLSSGLSYKISLNNYNSNNVNITLINNIYMRSQGYTQYGNSLYYYDFNYIRRVTIENDNILYDTQFLAAPNAFEESKLDNNRWEIDTIHINPSTKHGCLMIDQSNGYIYLQIEQTNQVYIYNGNLWTWRSISKLFNIYHHAACIWVNHKMYAVSIFVSNIYYI